VLFCTKLAYFYLRVLGDSEGLGNSVEAIYTRSSLLYLSSDATLTPLHFLHALDLDPSVNSLGPKFWSKPIEALDFGVSLILDPTVNPP
jgi:hypothetical protein